jgi:hypothetical protein
VVGYRVAAAGQGAYHLLAQDHVRHTPWGVTMPVSCPPVLVLGMGAALAHMLRGDAAHYLSQYGRAAAVADAARRDRSANALRRERLADAQAAAQCLIAAGERISRRSLRRVGLHGSNADLGALARMVKPQPLRVPW